MLAYHYKAKRRKGECEMLTNSFYHKIQRKMNKWFKYVKLLYLFSAKSEFKRIHPEQMKLWHTKFKNMIQYNSDRTFSILDEFLNAKITKVSEGVNTEELILICALKNDIEKIKEFMVHYRKRGIKQFVFLDNKSTDGTFEFLIEQEDATVYLCENTFSADRKIAWLNRLIAEYGMNRWYLMVDSDEFFTFLGDQKYTFADISKKADEKGYKRLWVVHLDVYPKGALFETSDGENFQDKYCYFDLNTYRYGKTDKGIKIVGGPRMRKFGTDNLKVSGCRMVYFEKEDIVPSAHFMIPYEKSYGTPVCLVSLHYKFVNKNDYKKMIEAVETGIHSNNSAEYKAYYEVMKEQPQFSFYDEKYSAIVSEENIRKLGFIDDLFVK